MKIFSSGSLRQVWLQASVAGSIWASFEIILGSFLHNLKIPLTGAILSFIGVWIMIAFQHLWKVNGLVWRAGLICALMKSISPSAIILGPMIGIFTEALLIEFSVRLLGKNLIAYIIGGGLAVLSTLVQKIISLIILYGLDLVRIFEALYKYAVKQTGLEHISAANLILLITSVYILAGITGAILGYRTGRQHSGMYRNRTSSGVIKLGNDRNLFRNDENEKYSVAFLVLNIAIMAAILGLLNFNLLIPGITAALSFITFCIIRYPGSMKRLKKPGFWVTFMLITFSAAFLWDWVSQGVFFTSDGLITGLKMNARAVAMITGFAAVSTELKNPVIKSVLYNQGFSSLYQSLSLSFSALPYLVSALNPKGTNGNAIRKKSLNSAFSHALVLYETFEKELEKRPAVFIVTGDVHQGKTTFAGKVAGLLREKGIKTGGFLATAINENFERTGFNLVSLSDGFSITICSRKPDENALRHGHYYFNPEAIDRGEEILQKAAKESDVIFIDEIGALELNGKGWNNALEQLCRNNVSPQVWVVRKSLVKKASRRWHVGEVVIIDISQDSESETADLIASKTLSSIETKTPEISQTLPE
ncbi:MAG: hypothetical protein GYA43_03040 [Bacteroidales bacterium]|nr:hypothetical protein [Bacteroidales bacterium]